MGFPQHKASMVRYVVPASKKLVVTLSQIVIFGVNEVGNIHVYRLFVLDSSNGFAKHI